MNEIPVAGETFRGDDGTVSTILPANYGQDYEASEGELEEYAEYIGIDPVKEPELMWIAQEGLRAPLPDGWRACQTDENEVYYFNFQSGESLWDHPMDEHYKEKVTTERAKLRGVGGGGGGGNGHKGYSAVEGIGGTRTGTTKAIADSFFLKPSTTAGPSALTISTPAASTNDGASAPRPSPDVSDILSLANTVSSPLGALGARTTAPQPFKLKGAETELRKRLEEQNEAQLRALRIEYGKQEDAERQRLEEAKTKLQRELDSAWEREKHGGDTANNNNTTATATQRRLQTAREAKQIEESWKSRLHDVTTRLTELQQKVDAQQQALQKSIHQSPEELRKALEARNAAEIAQLREAAKKQNDVVLQRIKAEHAAEQARAAAKTAEAAAAAEKLAEANAEQKAEERRRQNAAMLAALQAAVDAKKAELEAKEKAASTSNGNPASTSRTEAGDSPAAPVRQGLSEQDKAAIAAAQAAADAEVAEVQKTNEVALTRLKEEYEGKKREKEASLQQQQQQQHTPATTSIAMNAAVSANRSCLVSPVTQTQTPTRGALSRTASNNSSFSVHVMSPSEQAKLEEEDQKLKDEAEKAARIYEEETELMVANREAGRALTAAPPAAAAANVSAEAIAALSRTATQAQRARDAENARHSMAVKQLEAKHEQAVRLLKSQHEKSVGGGGGGSTTATSSSTAGFNPRQHPSFTAQLNARKRAWLRDHPTPAMEMPTLSPIPTLPTLTVSATMAASSMPDAEEQAKIIKTRLTQTREELRHRFDREMQAVQRSKEGELSEWQQTYRTQRLEEVREKMAALKKEKDVEVQRAKEQAESASSSAAAAAATAATAAAAAARAEAEAEAAARRDAEEKATAAATQKLRQAEADFQKLETTIAAGESESKAKTETLQREIAQLEGTLLTLTQEMDTEEKRREELRGKLTATTAEVADLQKQAELARAAAQQQQQQQQQSKEEQASSSSTLSMVLYIKDADAMAEERELRARWSALLASLRAAVEQEREKYEQTLSEGNTVSTPPEGAAAAELPGVHVSGPENGGQRTVTSSLPPTAPTYPTSYGAGQPQTNYYPNATNTSTAASTLGGFVTPLQQQYQQQQQQQQRRPSPSAVPFDLQSYLGEGSVPPPDKRLFASSQSPQQQQQQIPPAWIPGGAYNNASMMGSAFTAGSGMISMPAAVSRHGDPMHVLRGGSLTGPAYSTDASLLVPRMGGAAQDERQYHLAVSALPHHSLMYDTSRLAAERQPSYGDNHRPYTNTAFAMNSSGNAPVHAEEEQGVRLAALQQAVRERRHELQAQRREMEELREEWKADMHRCRERNDKAEARQLREVKAVLEERARQLNEEVLEVKEMQREIQEEVRRYRQLMRQRDGYVEEGEGENDGDEVRAGGRGNALTTLHRGNADTRRGSNSSSGGYGGQTVSTDVVELLQSIVSRTERLEKLLQQRSARSGSDRTPSPGQRGRRQS